MEASNLPGKLQASALVTGVLDASFDGLSIEGDQARINASIRSVNATLGKMGRSTIVFTNGGSSRVWDGRSTLNHNLKKMALLCVNSALSAVGAIDYSASQLLTTEDCLIGTPLECVADGMTAIGVFLDTSWEATFRNTLFIGWDAQVRMATATTGYANTVNFISCGWAGYGTIALQNPGEACDILGGAVHRGWVDPADTLLATVRFMSMVDIAGDISVSVTGLFVSDCHSSAPAASVFVVGATSDSGNPGSLTIKGGRTGGTDTGSFVEFTVNNPIVTSIENTNWTGGFLVDFNTSTGVRLGLAGVEQYTSGPWYQGTFPTVGVSFYGADSEKRIALGSDENRTSSTLSNSALLLALPNNSTWEFEVVDVSDGPEAGDFKADWTVPSGGSVPIWGLMSTGSAGSGNTDHLASSHVGQVTAAGVGSWGGADGSPATSIVRMTGVAVIGSTAGNLTLRWAQQAASGTSTLKAGSYLRARRVA
jgi:hypothetical protein